jgi:2-hydroxy-6-oxonona-2,4-dienedioate hydrolase
MRARVKGIYRTVAGRDAVRALYQRDLERLGPAYASRSATTRFGETHLLVAGPEHAPPLVVVHGANGSAVAMAGAFGALADAFRCHFVDVPGEPGRSAEVRLDKRGDALVRWMEDLLDALALERVAMLGMSGGGYAVLRFGCARSDRLSRAVLIVPEGLAAARRATFLASVLWPLLRYRLAPSEGSARRLAAALAGTEPARVPEATLEHLAAMRHVRSAANLGTPLGAQELARLRAPVLLVAAGRDVIFPGALGVARARQCLPDLRDVVMIEHAGHIHPDLVAPPVVARIRDFLSA